MRYGTKMLYIAFSKHKLATVFRILGQTMAFNRKVLYINQVTLFSFISISYSFWAIRSRFSHHHPSPTTIYIPLSLPSPSCTLTYPSFSAPYPHTSASQLRCLTGDPSPLPLPPLATTVSIKGSDNTTCLLLHDPSTNSMPLSRLLPRLEWLITFELLIAAHRLLPPP